MARDTGVLVRLTTAELAEWHGKAQAAGLSLSALIRQAMSRTHPWTPAARDIEQDRVRQLAMIGNNLNQLARWANTYKRVADAAQVLAQLSVIQREMHGLRIKSNKDAD